MYHQQGQRIPGYRVYTAVIAIVRYDDITAVNIKIRFLAM